MIQFAVSSGGICAEQIASASTTLAVSTAGNGIGGGLAAFEVGMLGPVLAGLAMRRRRAA